MCNRQSTPGHKITWWGTSEIYHHPHPIKSSATSKSKSRSHHPRSCIPLHIICCVIVQCRTWSKVYKNRLYHGILRQNSSKRTQVHQNRSTDGPSRDLYSLTYHAPVKQITQLLQNNHEHPCFAGAYAISHHQECSNNIIGTNSTPELAIYHQQTVGLSPKSTLLKAIKHY